MKNIYEIKDGIVYIKCRFTDDIFTIDETDLDLVSQCTWHMTKHKDRNKQYVQGNIEHKNILIHQLLLPKIEGLVIDHRDRNPLNNCRENLRYVTQLENRHNASMNTKNTSGYMGVYWHKKSQVWYARAKRVSLGTFKTKEEAAKAYRDFVTNNYCYVPELCVL